MLPLLLAGAGGAFVADQFQKAGERKEVKELLRKLTLIQLKQIHLLVKTTSLLLMILLEDFN